MTAHPSMHAIAAAVHLLPALVWGIVAYHSWRLRRDLELKGSLLLISSLIALLTCLHYVFHAVLELTPTELEGRALGLHAVVETVIAVLVVTSVALFRHMIPMLALPEEPRTTRWLVANYGVAGAASVMALVWLVVPGWRDPSGWFGPHIAPVVVALIMSALALRHGHRLARRGVWRAGPGVVELRSPDVIVVATAVGLTGALLLAMVLTGSTTPGTGIGLFVHTAMGLALALPFVVRMFGRVVRTFLVSVAMIGVTAALYGVVRIPASPEVAGLVAVAAIATLALGLVPAHAWFATVTERLVFRRGDRRQAELQVVLHALSPEAGVVACCTTALAGLCRVMRLRGAAIFLTDGNTVVHGAFDARALAAVWPRDAASSALLDRTFSEGVIRELPRELRDALGEAEVVSIVPIASRRRRWGHLLATEGLLTTPSSSEDAAEIAAFVAQLAIVLDAAELVARAVAVERSLAHAEKLAAIGETAARIAHDIRNPVAAARSLAQQLAQEPGVAFGAELGVILAELERVERQVADLLRFARQDRIQLESTDLAGLVRATLARFAPRFAQTDIVTDVALAEGVTAVVDREKIHQVLVNVIENAIDALAADGADRRLRVTLGADGGVAHLCVSDNGPGVDADAVARLFEPFFSLKAHGTGLGLAIAKRTIDAHGGRIHAERGADAGMTIHVELPLETP